MSGSEPEVTLQQIHSFEIIEANGDTKIDESSSSDQDRGRKSSPKRNFPKSSKKGGRSAVKRAVHIKKRESVSQTRLTAPIETGSDSEKESRSDTDPNSDVNGSAHAKKSVNLVGKEPRKRGRKPKREPSKNDKSEKPRPKEIKEEDIQPQRDHFHKPPVGQLKKTGESFL
ncbi:unnamed protein product [Diabrotica balteata]|uniref:Uncharacterized protein n=1 Tax=Diabrotica balteata TaxID=107213 RepID=A0A9N9SUU7_DIABA|nr:unnamed protein product [Diabrotica balteata]